MSPPRLLLPIACSVVLFGCGTSAPAGGSDSGISGSAHIGPICPVQRPGASCQRPLAGTLLVLDAVDGRVVARVRTARNGTFSVSLAPGRYALRADRVTPGGSPPIEVTVRPHRYTQLTVSIDSGIR